jgi:hypothetical protein
MSVEPAKPADKYKVTISCDVCSEKWEAVCDTAHLWLLWLYYGKELVPEALLAKAYSSAFRGRHKHFVDIEVKTELSDVEPFEPRPVPR